jgi:hypothetical protein
MNLSALVTDHYAIGNYNFDRHEDISGHKSSCRRSVQSSHYFSRCGAMVNKCIPDVVPLQSNLASTTEEEDEDEAEKDFLGTVSTTLVLLLDALEDIEGQSIQNRIKVGRCPHRRNRPQIKQASCTSLCCMFVIW